MFSFPSPHLILISKEWREGSELRDEFCPRRARQPKKSFALHCSTILNSPLTNILEKDNNKHFKNLYVSCRKHRDTVPSFSSGVLSLQIYVVINFN